MLIVPKMTKNINKYHSLGLNLEISFADNPNRPKQASGYVIASPN